MKSRNLYPFFVGAFPVLFLYGQNVDELPLGVLTIPLVIVTLATTGLLLALTRVVRDAGKASLITSIVMLLALSYGHAYGLVAGPAGPVGRHPAVMHGWIIFGALLILVISRIKAPSDETTLILNSMAIFLVLMPLFSIASHKIQEAQHAANAASVSAPIALKVPEGSRKPDIYYIVPDRYAGRDTLREWGFDNARFLKELRERGFHVPNGWANYPRTTHSLASSLNMQYLDDLQPDSRAQSWVPLFRILQKSKVSRSLQNAGYSYVHIGSWWQQTSVDPSADVNITAPVTSHFTRALYETTMIKPLAEWFFDPRREYWETIRYQFDQLEKVRSIEGPTFAFAHLLVPHEPWVIGTDGGFLTKSQEASNTAVQNYLNQVEYVNRRTLELIDSLQTGDPASDPVIIIQSDEGPFAPGYWADPRRFRWDKASFEELRTKLNILNAIYMPRLERGTSLGTTPINTFRTILNNYLGADLDMLPERIWVYRDDYHPHDYTEVTDRVRKR